jgi:hypothetical protein
MPLDNFLLRRDNKHREPSMLVEGVLAMTTLISLPRHLVQLACMLLMLLADVGRLLVVRKNEWTSGSRGGRGGRGWDQLSEGCGGGVNGHNISQSGQMFVVE